MPHRTPAAETATLPPEIHTPLALAILDRLFAIESHLPTAAEWDALRATLATQAHMLTALHAEVGRLRLELAQERHTRHTALALQLSAPEDLQERAVGRPPRA